MPKELHCSACDALIQPAAQRCPGCGPQLTAQAGPAVCAYVPRFSFWKILLVAMTVVVIAGHIISSASDRHKTEARATVHAALAAGTLNTPELIQAQCGKALTQKASTLYYPIASGNDDLAVAFPAGAAPTFTIDAAAKDIRGQWKNTFKPADENFVERFCAAAAR
jgi:hypothetical protein